MASDWIVVECRAVGCRAELYLNDIPVARAGFDMATATTMPVNQYVVTGANEFAVVVKPGPTPAQALEPAPKPEAAGGLAVTATVSQYRRNSVSGDGSGVVLATIAWIGKGGDELEQFPVRLTAPMSVPLELGPWQWQGAEPLTLDQPTIDHVGVLIEAIRSGLAAGDPRSFLELGSMSLREIARAFGDSPEAGANVLRALVDDGRQAPHWRFPPVPRDRWSLRLVAGGRMIECVDADWEPIVRSITDAEDNSFSMPMFVGRTATGWSVMR